MKSVVKKMLMVGALVTAGGVSAEWGDVFPFMGFDYYQVFMKGNRDWGSTFPKSYPGATLYIGTKFHENFGLEIGADWSAKKSQKDNYLQSTFMKNQTNPTGLSTSTNLKRNGAHLDLITYLPIVDSLELTGHIGVGWVHPKVEIATNFGSSSSQMASALVTTTGKTKALVRLAIGLNYMVTEMVGIRAKLGWENSSALRLSGNSSFNTLGFNTKGFKDSKTAAVGMFVKF
jgi:hypothetical protein